MNEVEIIVRGTDRTGSTFSRIRENIRGALNGSMQDANAGGTGIASRLMGNIIQGVSSAAGQVQETLSGVFQGGLKGALSSGPIGLIIVGAIVTAIAVAAPAIATAIAGALVLGLGAGLLGLGAIILMQNDKIKERVMKSWSGIKDTLTAAFEPLIPVLEFLGQTLGDVAKKFAPVIKGALEVAQGPLKTFIEELGKAFEALKPAIAPLMKAFTSLITTLGPMLPDVFASISDAVIELSDAVVENKAIIAAMFTLLLYLIPRVIDVIRTLTNWFGEMVRFVMRQVSTWQANWAAFKQAVSNFADSARTTVNNVKTFLNNMISFITGLPGRIAGAVGNMFAAIPNAARNAVNQAKSWLAGLAGSLNPFASGGIVGASRAAGGGPRGNMTLVGENGPEIVKLPFGSSVRSSANTQATLSGAGNRGGLTVNLYVAGSILTDRDIEKVIRDSVLRGGFRGLVST